MPPRSKKLTAQQKRALAGIRRLAPEYRQEFAFETTDLSVQDMRRRAVTWLEEHMREKRRVRAAEAEARIQELRARHESARQELMATRFQGDDGYDDEMYWNESYPLRPVGSNITPDESIEQLREWMLRHRSNILFHGRVFVIRIDDVTGSYYTLNAQNFYTLFRELLIANTADFEESEESDNALVSAVIRSNSRWEVTPWVASSTLRNMDPDRNTGAFLPFVHLIKDEELETTLAKMGLFAKVTPENYETNCLVHSVKDVVSPEVLQDIMSNVRNSTVPRKHLTQIGKKYDLSFIVHTDGDVQVRRYGTSDGRIVNICLFRNHYFPFIPDTKVTGFAIDNYAALKAKYPTSWKMKKNLRGSTHPKGISSMALMKKLYSSQSLLEPIDMSSEEIWKTVHLSKVMTKGFTCLEFPESAIKPVHPARGVFEDKKDFAREIKMIKHYDRVIKEREGGSETIERLEKQAIAKKLGYAEKEALYRSNVIPTATIFFDFESSTEGVHKPYMVAWQISGESDIYHRTGSTCAQEFLEWIVFMFETDADDVEVTLIAHNMSYDISFLLELINPGSFTNVIKRGHSFISATGQYGPIILNFKDSYKLIPTALKEFSKMFDYPNEKEIMPYAIYTQAFIEGDFLLDPEELHANYSQEFIDAMKVNVLAWECERSGKWDMLKYSRIYCERDVELLAVGWDKFRAMTLEFFDIDINAREILTVAAMSYQHLKNECFENTYSVSGIILEFIRRSTTGGQTQSKQNKSMLIEDEILDQDKRSLYPSAMVEMPGVPIGKPKVFVGVIPWDACYFFVEIDILAVDGPAYDFPILALRDEEGINNWTNDIVGHRVIVGQQTLNDLIDWNDKFEYKVRHGYYWNEGWNVKLSSTIDKMYNKRDELKGQGNPAQLIFKLLMNAAYGRTGKKPIDSEDHYKEPKDLNRYVTNNHDRINKMNIMPNGDVHIVAKKAINQHFNQQHVASMVLEKAKHLMRKVLLLQQRVGSPLRGNIYYTDTDSVHVSRAAWTELEQIYKDKYGESLDGKKLGQFHSDFDISGTYQIDDDHKLVPSFATKQDLNGGNLVSRKLYVCGKKAYLDVLTSEKNSDITLYHFRLKGVPESSIINKCNTQYDGEIEQLYYELLQGKKIEFILSGRFRTGDDGIYSTVSMTRNVQFKPADLPAQLPLP